MRRAISSHALHLLAGGLGLIASTVPPASAQNAADQCTLAAGGESQPEPNSRFHLRSDPLATPIRLPCDPAGDLITYLEIEVELKPDGAGFAKFLLDDSTWQFNDFGDGKRVQENARRSTEVELRCESPTDQSAQSTFVLTVRAARQTSPPSVVLFLDPTGKEPNRLAIGEVPAVALPSGQTNRLSPTTVVPLHMVPGPGVTAQPVGPPEKERLRDDVYMISEYFPNESGSGSKIGHIQLDGRLSAQARLDHDRNHVFFHWSDQEFQTQSTLLAPIAMPIALEDTKRPDPDNAGRRLLKIRVTDDMIPGASRLQPPPRPGRRAQRRSHDSVSQFDPHLVVAPFATGPHRLILRKQGQVRHVLPLRLEGHSPWLALQASLPKVTAQERQAIEEIARLVPRNFFHGYYIENGHVERLTLIGENATIDTLAQLQHLTHLRNLNISSLQDVSAGEISQALAYLHQLRSLALRNVLVTDDVLRQIGELPNLESLAAFNLHETAISDTGIEHLARLKRLKSLNLEGKNVTDRAIGQLAMFRQLEHLSLFSTQITKSGATKLRGSLPDCKVMLSPEDL